MADDIDDLLGNTNTPAPERESSDCGCLAGKSPNYCRNLRHAMTRACPPNEKGKKSFKLLAFHLECTPAGLYAMCDKGRITYARAKQLVALGNGRVHIMDFEPYLI
jgi:hypothetical protein